MDVPDDGDDDGLFLFGSGRINARSLPPPALRGSECASRVEARRRWLQNAQWYVCIGRVVGAVDVSVAVVVVVDCFASVSVSSLLGCCCCWSSVESRLVVVRSADSGGWRGGGDDIFCSCVDIVSSY